MAYVSILMQNIDKRPTYKKDSTIGNNRDTSDLVVLYILNINWPSSFLNNNNIITT